MTALARCANTIGAVRLSEMIAAVNFGEAVAVSAAANHPRC
jgi:hypothetical protein